MLHALQGYAAHECSEGAAQALSPRPALLRQRGRSAHPDAFLHLLLCPSEVKRPGHSSCPLHPAITTTPRPTPGAASCNHVQKLSPVKDALDQLSPLPVRDLCTLPYVCLCSLRARTCMHLSPTLHVPVAWHAPWPPAMACCCAKFTCASKSGSACKQRHGNAQFQEPRTCFPGPASLGVPRQVTPYQGLPHSRGPQPLVALKSGTKLPGAENEEPRSQLSAQQVTHQPQLP